MARRRTMTGEKGKTGQISVELPDEREAVESMRVL
jgi:hypothetical protein